MSATNGNLGDQSLWIWHVGARGGYMPICFPGFLDQGVKVLFIDAAADSHPVTIELADGRRPRIQPTHVDACVAGSESERMFEVRACPYASGIRAFDQSFDNWRVFGNGPCDYVLGAAHEVIESRPIRTTTLDGMVHAGNTSMPTVLVVDAQGVSDEILLEGGREVLRNVAVLIVEVELLPFFGGVASFATLLPELWKYGLAFAGFLPEEESWASPVRLPIGQRCAPIPGSKDAIFIRIPQRLAGGGELGRLAQYVAACAMMGQIDFGLSVLYQLSTEPTRDPDGVPSVRSFIADLWCAQRAMPVVFPPEWRAECATGDRIQRSPIFALERMASSQPTPVEAVLLDYDFGLACDELKRRRMAQARIMLSQESRLNSERHMQ